MCMHDPSASFRLVLLHCIKTLRRIPISLTTVESQPIVVSGECDLGPLGEVEDISGNGMHLVARLVGDIKTALEDDLHLVIGVLVYQRCPFLKTVEPGGDGLLWVFILPVF